MQEDKAALLAAINEAATKITHKRGGAADAASNAGSSLMKKANVNAHVARDLVSNAGAGVGDMRDFQTGSKKQSGEQFEHGKTLLNRPALGSESRQGEDDLRSVRSEYDYGSKRKFVDVLGNVSNNAKLARLRAAHEIEKAGGAPSAKGSQRTGVTSYRTYQSSQKSKVSKMTGIKAGARSPVLDNPIQEAELDDELEAKPEDFSSCNSCPRELSEDEKIINARFVNEAMAADRDISLFPICISCNFENLESSARGAQAASKKYAAMKQDKDNYFPTNKKQFGDANMHKNSEEFKQLGTIHHEKRTADYYPLEKPQPKLYSHQQSTTIPMERVMEERKANDSASALQYRSSSVVDTPADQKSHTSRISSLKADRKKDEEIRKKLVTDEIVAMRHGSPRATSAQKKKVPSLFPTTTNQENHNEDIHAMRILDKANFKRKNPFGAYVNSMFNQGVFVNPWQDGC